MNSGGLKTYEYVKISKSNFIMITQYFPYIAHAWKVIMHKKFKYKVLTIRNNIDAICVSITNYEMLLHYYFFLFPLTLNLYTLASIIRKINTKLIQKILIIRDYIQSVRAHIAH